MPQAPNLLHVFPTFRIGGAQRRFVTIANHLGFDFRHIVATMDGDYQYAKHLNPALNVERLEVQPRKGSPLANWGEFRRLLRRTNPDVLITYNWGSIEWALANWPRIVRHIHVEDGFGPEEANGQLPRRIWTRRLALRSSTVVVPSLNLQRIAISMWRLKSDNVRYIPNGIDCTKYGVVTAVQQIPWLGAGPVVGTVAVLRREKNLSQLLEAFAAIRQEMICCLVIVGDGPERAQLESLAGELGIANSVFFAGYVAEPAPLYQTFDVFALPSDTEQMPYSVMEAMAAALPMAATDVGDVRAMLAPENHRYVVPRDSAAFARALKDLLLHTESRKHIGLANQTKARRDFDETAMFASYGELFRGNRRVTPVRRRYLT
jgi:glycosyltransferase involved in cell wall biosynthesis